MMYNSVTEILHGRDKISTSKHFIEMSNPAAKKKINFSSNKNAFIPKEREQLLPEGEYKDASVFYKNVMVSCFVFFITS